jgi:phospholipid/cholesterol/gamma-HCH transport system permease protein
LEQTDGAAFDRTNDTVERARAQFAGREEGLPEEEQEDNVFAIAGGAFLETTRQSVAYMQLAADVTHWVIPGVFGTRHQRKGSYLTQCLRIGAESTGIVFVLSLIIGVILTVQSAVQLVQFGASIFVADLLAVSVLREMGPMITAIIVAGRSGSSIASEIATMQVTDELDALEVLGINPVRYTVIPRILAAVTMVPLLTAISVTAALIGGGAVAFAYLGISPLIFFRQASEVVDGGDLFITLLKSAVFAWQIVLVAGYYGLNATGGAAGVGKVTTQAVVASIFSVIVIDVLFSLLYIV